jgi:hypothetical protein
MTEQKETKRTKNQEHKPLFQVFQLKLTIQ